MTEEPKKVVLSRGHAALLSILKQFAPNEKVETEYPIGERLRLDIYCAALKLSIEFHGRQHFEYVEHFHGNKQGFLDSQQRDARKQELCEENDITLVVFRYDDDLSEGAVFDRVLDAVRNSKQVEKKNQPSKYKGDPYYEASKERQRQWRKQQYQKIKKERKKP